MIRVGGIRVERGGVFYALHPKHLRTPHWFVVVTDRTLHRRCVAVMITDAAGFHPPRVLIPKGTPVTPAFLLTKDSTIHDADAYILPWEKADESVRLGVFDNYHREINPALVEFGRRVANASDLWDDDLFEYVVELDWNVPDEPA